MKKYILLFLLFMVLFSGCGTTQLVVMDANTDIYINGKRKGSGSVEIRRSGIPQRLKIKAVKNSEQVGAMEINRKIDLVTFFVGTFTYGLGFIFWLRYPAMVIIPTASPSDNENIKRESVWEKPPKSWGKKQ